MRGIPVAASVMALATGCLFINPQTMASAPPPAPTPTSEATPYWTVGRNDAIITARDRQSKVWADILHGSIGETYYPTINVADSRTIEFVVVHDGHATPVSAMQHQYQWTAKKALAVTVLNTPSSRHYTLNETIFTNPHANAIVMTYHLFIQSGNPEHYQLYVFSNPHLNNQGSQNQGSLTRSHGNPILLAQNGQVSSAIASREPFQQASVGYMGQSDGLTQLSKTGILTPYASALGNIGETGELPVSGRWSSGEVAIGYGSTTSRAIQAAQTTLSRPAPALLGQFVAQWHHYLAPLYRPHHLGATLTQQYWTSLMTIKAAEDKTYVGAMAASLTTPWGEDESAEGNSVTGYHMSWVRDSYQMASALLAAGDRRTAQQILQWYFTVDEYPNGNFPQNSFVNGKPYWTGQELDQNGFPVILAYQLHDDGPTIYAKYLEPALRYILYHGPWTNLDRWEEASGFSPNTMAVDIAALALGSRIAAQDGHPHQAAIYQGVARHWLTHVVDWTTASSGPWSSQPYFVRITTAPGASSNHFITIANGGNTYPQTDIIDQGFLSLVRLGLIAPSNPVIRNSLQVVDQAIRVNTPNGPSFYRYNHDRYGNYANGAPYNGSGHGGLWPVLDGERGEYDLAANLDGLATRHTPLFYLQTMQKMAYGLGMIPEQVWPFTTTIPASSLATSPSSASIGLKPGVATGSAAPLDWAMGQYVRLAVDISQHRLVDSPRALSQMFDWVHPTPSSLPLTAQLSPAISIPLPSTGPYSVDSMSWVVYAKTPSLSGYTAPHAEVTVADVSHDGMTTTTTSASAKGQYTLNPTLNSGLNTLEITTLTHHGMQKTLTAAVTYEPPALASWRHLPFDDQGPGWYQYPTGGWYQKGMLDMTSVAVRNLGATDQINVSYDVLHNICGGANGFSTKLIEIYLVNPTNSGSTSTASLPYSNIGFTVPWNYALRVSGFDTKLINAQGAVLSRSLTVTTNPLTRTVSINIPSSLIGGAFAKGWGLYVTTLSQDGYAPEEVRPIAQTAEPYEFGYVYADPYGYPTNVMDVLTPKGTPQAALDYLKGPIELTPVTIP